MTDNLAQLLADPPGGVDGSALALIDPYYQVSRDLLKMKAALVAHELDRRGAGRNVGILLPNSPLFAISLLGVLMSGRTAVPLNPVYVAGEFGHIFRDAGVRHVLTSNETQLRCAPALSAVPSAPELVDVHAACAATVHGNTYPAANPDDVAMILYTSGTTGRQKGVMLTHRNLASNARASATALGMTRDDCTYCVLPLFHSFALTMMNMSLYAGGRVVFDSVFRPATLLEAVPRHGVTMVFMTPSHYSVLLRTGRVTPELWSGVRVTLSGGAPLPLSTIQRWREATGRELLNGYGLTEASPVIALNRPGKSRDGSIGPLVDGVEAEIRGDSGDTGLPGGAVGELYVRGPNVMRGYLNQPDETMRALAPRGWLRTGDLGTMDDDGFIYLTGRGKELIIFGGENIMPQEVEHALLEHPAVAEAAVVGVPDETHGERPHACVVLHEGATATAHDLREHLRPLLAPYKIPRGIMFLDRFPRNSMGKVLKDKLSARAAVSS